ncbi:MAG: phosphoglucosamine mutase [Gemmatimonadetes bacterium]|nr:phosphoglucosamine mutase [Gemmatimonadota bacterium]
MAERRWAAAVVDQAVPVVDRGAVRARGFRVVLDACAGAGALPAVPLLEALGVDVHGLHLEPTGRFPRDPEPTAANLSELAAAVRESRADLGLAIDPDGDRLALVDERGEPVGEDLTLALAVDHVLGESRGPVVTNLSTSQVVERVAELHGVAVERTAVGEVNVATRMLELGSPIGGEGNGGVIHPGIHHTRDAPVAIALLLSYLARTDRSLAEAVARFPGYAIRKAKIPLHSVDAGILLQRAVEAFPEAEPDRTDGLRLAWPDLERWVHLRESGTEPVVRLIAEARNAETADGLLDRLRELAGTRPFST